MFLNHNIAEYRMLGLEGFFFQPLKVHYIFIWYPLFMMRVGTLVLFLILGGSFQSFIIKYHDSCGFSMLFIRLKVFPSIPRF